jgi:hypothetical protein
MSDDFSSLLQHVLPGDTEPLHDNYLPLLKQRLPAPPNQFPLWSYGTDQLELRIPGSKDCTEDSLALLTDCDL